MLELSKFPSCASLDGVNILDLLKADSLKGPSILGDVLQGYNSEGLDNTAAFCSDAAPLDLTRMCKVTMLDDQSLDGVAGSPNGKRKNRGSKLNEYIKAEEDSDREDSAFDASDETGSSSGKRPRCSSPKTTILNIADLDEETRQKMRREKNRVAARKCRAKKMHFMQEMLKTLKELLRKNEEYKLQVITWHKMFSREVRLRESMKRIIQTVWSCQTVPSSTGLTANDVIIGLESGTLDVNKLVMAMQYSDVNPVPALWDTGSGDVSNQMQVAPAQGVHSGEVMLPPQQSEVASTGWYWPDSGLPLGMSSSPAGLTPALVQHCLE